jgi:polar amino acid transport system substrate-binding protein
VSGHALNSFKPRTIRHCRKVVGGNLRQENLRQEYEHRESKMRSSHSGNSTGLEGKLRAFSGSRILAVAVVSALLVPPAQGLTEEAAPLRLCADPTNLPFSSDDPSQPGFYLEIGQAISQALDRPIAYDWYKSYFGKRTVRVTLLGKHCDAMIGLPLSEDFMGPAVIFSRKITTESYALVSAGGQAVNGIGDLRGKRVVVQYQTTPQNLLAQRDDIEKVTVLSPEEGMKVLDQGKADVAFILGPVAGWLNKTRYGDRYRIQSTEGDGLSWDVAIGFAKSSGQLRDQVDSVLPRIEATIAALAAKYGLPTDRPIRFSSSVQATTDMASIAVSVQSPLSPQPIPATALSAPSAAAVLLTVADAAPAAPKPEQVNAGKEIFNGTCGHCHGPDAIQSERRIDLRLLQNRYGDEIRSKFWTTVHEGRPAKGMPAWKEVFTDDQFESILAFLLTVQSPADSTN